MSIDLGAPRPDFVGSHELIPVILGATAFLDDLARCVDDASGRDAPVPANDGLLVDALLGLLALRRSLRCWLEAADVVAAAGAPAQAPMSSDPTEGSYLR